MKIQKSSFPLAYADNILLEIQDPSLPGTRPVILVIYTNSACMTTIVCTSHRNGTVAKRLYGAGGVTMLREKIFDSCRNVNKNGFFRTWGPYVSPIYSPIMFVTTNAFDTYVAIIYTLSRELRVRATQITSHERIELLKS